MHLRTLLLAGMTGVLGWVARGTPDRTPEPAPVTAVAPAPVRVVVVPAPDVEEEEEEEEHEEESDVPFDDDAAGQDLGELLARAEQRAEQPHNAVHGQITDARSNEPLPGATVIASAPHLAGSQAAITDENGNYQLTNLPAGSYLLTFYYLDVTVERDNVTVSSLDSTLVSQRLDSTMVANEPIRVHGNDDYVVNIPVGRTLEGVMFSGATTLDNTYVVDDVDSTDMWFGE